MSLVTGISYGCIKDVAGYCNFIKMHKMMHITASSLWLIALEPQNQNYLNTICHCRTNAEGT
jgi:hypothetical protein